MPKLHEVIKRQMEAKGLEPVQVAALVGVSQRRNRQGLGKLVIPPVPRSPKLIDKHRRE